MTRHDMINALQAVGLSPEDEDVPVVADRIGGSARLMKIAATEEAAPSVWLSLKPEEPEL